VQGIGSVVVDRLPIGAALEQGFHQRNVPGRGSRHQRRLVHRQTVLDAAIGQFGATSTAPPIAAARPLVFVSAKDEFSAEWSRAREGTSELIVHLGSDLLPYWMLKASMRLAELATLDVDTSASREPITKWRRSDPPTNPPRFSLSATGTLSANLGAVAPDVDDRLIFLTMRL
jgi:hypothetical protein